MFGSKFDILFFLVICPILISKILVLSTKLDKVLVFFSTRFMKFLRVTKLALDVITNLMHPPCHVYVTSLKIDQDHKKITNSRNLPRRCSTLVILVLRDYWTKLSLKAIRPSSTQRVMAIFNMGSSRVVINKREFIHWKCVQ